MTRFFREFGWLVVVSLAVGSPIRAGRLCAQEVQPATDSPILSSASSAFIRRHRSDAWSVAGMAAANSGSEDGDAVLALFYTDEPGRQYVRRLWVPAQTRRYDWAPFQIPGRVVNADKQVSVRTAMLDVSGSREVLQRRRGELLANEMILAIDTDPIKTAAYFRKPLLGEEPEGAFPDEDVSDTVGLARTTTGLSVRVSQTELDFLPPWVEVLRTYDNMILTADRIQSDSAGQAALRSWLITGGRLWIALDRVSPETIDLLLGNAVDLQIVDRVELDQYKLLSRDAIGGAVVEENCEFDVPVEMVRVVTSASDIPCRVNGWPAAIRVPYGEGEVLITTLGARGWRDEYKPQPTRALTALANRLFQLRRGSPSPLAFQTGLEQRIGYKVPRRSFAVAILGSYCGVLLLAGLALGRTKRLERLAWVVPAVTLTAALIFVVLGVTNSNRVPPTLAHAQLVQFLPQSNEARVEGLAAIYDQQSREVTWRSAERSWILPDLADDASVRRLIWTDQDGTETQNASIKAGSIGLATESAVRQLPQHVGVHARFGPEGLEGLFSQGELEGVEDAVLLNPAAPPLAVKLDALGRLVATPDDVLAAGQFTSEALLSDEQRRRQDVMRRLFDPADNVQFPWTPSLAFWSRPLEAAMTYPEGVAVSGVALGVLALDLERTLPGTRFRIPAPFLRTSALPGRSGTTTAYESRLGQWVRGLTRPTEVVLRFQLPDQVLPGVLDRGVLTIRGNAPSRSIQILAFQGSELKLVREFRNLNGVVTTDLSREHLTLDAQGGVRLTVLVGETEGQRLKRETEEAAVRRPNQGSDSSETDMNETVDNSTWQFEYVRLTVDGQTKTVGE